MSLHERPGKSDERYTPEYIFTALGCVFDLDVASPGRRIVPWIPTHGHWTCGALERQWKGFVWMNPPFGGRGAIEPWLKKFFYHHEGIALVPDRTSAPWWRKWAGHSDLILFVAPKIKFIDARGRVGPSPANGTALFGCGEQGRVALRRAAFDFGLGTLVQPVRNIP